MDTFAPFQKLVSLSATPPSGTGEIIQSRSGYLDLADATAALVRVEILFISNGTLNLETGNSEEGPWFVVKPYTSSPVDETVQVATYYSAQNKLARFLRWRFVTTTAATNGRITFRLRYQVGG